MEGIHGMRGRNGNANAYSRVKYKWNVVGRRSGGQEKSRDNIRDSDGRSLEGMSQFRDGYMRACKDDPYMMSMVSSSGVAGTLEGFKRRS